MFGSYRVLRWILRHYVAQDDAGGSALPMHHALKPQSEAPALRRALWVKVLVLHHGIRQESLPVQHSDEAHHQRAAGELQVVFPGAFGYGRYVYGLSVKSLRFV